MALAPDFDFVNQKAFQAKLKLIQSKVDNLTLPLKLISKDFFKSQRAIWQLKGPGAYTHLAVGTITQKQNQGINPYPALFRTGLLKGSMTNPGHSLAINEVINKRTLIMGTKVEYGQYHQRGNSNLPRRPFLFIGPEAPQKVADIVKDKGKGRLERWVGILDNFMAATLRKAFK